MIQALAFTATIYLTGDPGFLIACEMSNGDLILERKVVALSAHSGAVEFYVPTELAGKVSFRCHKE